VPLLQNDARIVPISNVTELIGQPGTEVLAVSNPVPAVRDEAHNAPAPRVVTCESLIWVIPPPKKSSSRKKKVTKTDPVTYGPADFVSDSTWAQFLAQLAGIVDSLPSLLALPSLEWRWQKPANSLWVPLQDENRYSSFIRKLHDARCAPSVIFRMDAPAAPQPTAPTPATPVVSEI
jgi:hypothetical protein